MTCSGGEVRGLQFEPYGACVDSSHPQCCHLLDPKKTSRAGREDRSLQTLAWPPEDAPLPFPGGPAARAVSPPSPLLPSPPSPPLSSPPLPSRPAGRALRARGCSTSVRQRGRSFASRSRQPLRVVLHVVLKNPRARAGPINTVSGRWTDAPNSGGRWGMEQLPK